MEPSGRRTRRRSPAFVWISSPTASAFAAGGGRAGRLVRRSAVAGSAAVLGEEETIPRPVRAAITASRRGNEADEADTVMADPSVEREPLLWPVVGNTAKVDFTR